MAEDEPDVIVGTRPVLTRRNEIGIALSSLGLVVVVLFVIRWEKWTYLVVMGVPLVMTVVRLVRPVTVVSGVGISRPWHRVPFLPWTSIDHVVEPAYLSDVQVVSTDGRTVTVTGVDASLSDRVAALGGKPVRPLQVPTSARITKEPTQREIEADVARRAAALEAERRRMADSEKRWPSS